MNQILTNDDEVCIPRFSSILLAEFNVWSVLKSWNILTDITSIILVNLFSFSNIHILLKQNVEKRGRRDVPGSLKKVPGLLDFISSGTFWSWDLQGL